MYMEERHRLILDLVEKQGRVSVNELSDNLGVSAVTIRQDLRALADKKLVQRTHGGAVKPQATSLELSFEVRQRENAAVKSQLAAYAAERVESGDSIALDASTTVFAMLPYLKQLERLTIVTNSLMIATSCLESPQVEVVLPGGTLRRDSISLVDSPHTLPDINLRYGFFGAHGLDIANGVTESSLREVNMKQAFMERCTETALVVDETKWGKIAPYTLAAPTGFSTIITTTDAPYDLVKDFQNCNAHVDIMPNTR